MAGIRTSSDVYRTRTLEQWVADVRTTGATSLTAWASSSRSSYNAARVLGMHRQVAAALSWKPKLPNGALRTLTSEDFARRFCDRGARTPSDMWRINNAWCKVLKRQGRLNEVRELIDVAYLCRRHPPTLEYFLNECRQFDFFEAWTCADRVAAQTARRLGLLDNVRSHSRGRPGQFSTQGGPVTSMAELVVARILEHNRIPFVTQPEYPFRTVGARIHPQRADFLLRGKFWVEVWMHTMHDSQLWPRTSRYLTRRRRKMAWCRRYGLRLVNIEGAILYRAGLAVFVEHCRLALQDASAFVETDIEPRELLAG